jgi:hypothetical protein
MDSRDCAIEENTVYSDNPDYGDDILLNTNFKKPESVCSFNQVLNNETETIHLMGNENTYMNTIGGNTWEGGSSTYSQDSGVGVNIHY